MSKRKTEPLHVCTITAQQQFEMRKPRYNAWAYRGGMYDDTRHSRRYAKAELRRLLDEER